MCGLHIWYTLQDAQGYTVTGGSSDYLMGVAWGGGKVLFDNKFCRCEYAGVLCLIDPFEYGPLIRTEYRQFDGGVHRTVDVTEEIHQFATNVAERYDIPLLSQVKAMEFAQEFGVWVWGLKDLKGGGVFIEGIDD
jgi:hypothetical protein